MIPLKLELSNFLSYQTRVELDFDSIHLACIAGENGAGKSSLLDSITWALFGKCRASSRDDVVNRQVVSSGGTARVLLEFQLEAHTYRVIRSQPVGKTGELELYLDAGEHNWKPLSQSSITGTQKLLETLLRMNYETFTNASFLLQGRADEFTIKRPGERKRILGDLLGVSHWERYREEALSRRRLAETDLANVKSLMDEIDRELGQETERKLQLASAKQEYDAAKNRREAQQNLVHSIQVYEAAVKQQREFLQTLDGNLERAKTALERMKRSQRERAAEKEQFQRILSNAFDIEQQYEEWQKAEKKTRSLEEKAREWNRLDRERQGEILQVEQARSRLEQELLQLERRQMQANAQQVKRSPLETQLAQAQKQVAHLLNQLLNKKTVETKHRHLQDKVGEINAQQTQLVEEMQKMKARQIQLEDEKSGQCPLCNQELTGEHRTYVIAQIATEGKKLGDLYRTNVEKIGRYKKELDAIHTDRETLEKAEYELRSAERNEATLRTRLDELDKAVADWKDNDLPRLGIVRDQLTKNKLAPEAQTRILQLEEAIRALDYQVDMHENARRQADELAGAQLEYQRLAEARAANQPLETTLRELERQVSEQQIQLERLVKQHNQAKLSLEELGPPPAVELGEAERALNHLRELEVIANKTIGAAEQSLAVLETLRRQRKEHAAKRKATTGTIQQLKILERVFGRNGVQALLIEQALPAIEDHANQLLSRLSDGEMHITFSTQRQLKSRDALAETLDIHISDSIGERPYEMYSGGEAFRVNFAIRIALSRLLSQRAGARLQTLVIDEGFGSQDPEGRQRLVEAINAIQDDFARVLVITHIDELRDAFPVRIEVSKNLEGSHLTVV